MALGEVLRKARESRKLTASEVAAATHMKIQTVEAIEREDFSRMPAAIYCKGFIKLYAEYMGLDPDPLTREYVERFLEPPPQPEQEEQEEEPGIFHMGFNKKDDDLPPFAQDDEDDEDHPDLFAYGKKRTEEPPEKLFNHTPPAAENDARPTSPQLREKITGWSSKMTEAVSALKEKIQASIPERPPKERKEPSAVENVIPETDPEVDTSPITLINKQVFIISGAVAGVILLVFLISVAARFVSEDSETVIHEPPEQELILPVEPPPPYIN